MGQYKYRAVHADGEPVTGTMEESSAHRVTAILQERGLQVSEVGEVGRGFRLPSLKRPLKWQDLNLLNNHLLSISRSGLPFAPAFAALARDVQPGRLRTAARQMAGAGPGADRRRRARQ